MERLIRNVDPKSWASLKSEAAKHGKTMGHFLTQLVQEHAQMEKKNSNWDTILNRKGILTDKEAEAMKKSIAEAFEKECGFEG